MERQERKCFLPKLVETAQSHARSHSKTPPSIKNKNRNYDAYLERCKSWRKNIK
jgi:hypothetical protein